MTTNNFDPYAILGVSKSTSVEEIKRAYRKLAQRLHPDANPDNPGASKQFQEITTAYDILSDSISRRHFDEAASENYNSGDLFFSLRVTTSKRTIMPLEESQVIYMLAEILPPPQLQQDITTTQSRINLTLVLDHSNSMNGVRLDKVKVAAHQIIDNLSEDDVISVVTFNDRAEVIIPATRISDRQSLKAKVSLMSAFGGTEIYQGLSKGVIENEKFNNPKMVNHVILLTDGHTFGDQDRCLELAGISANKGIGISAIGLGHDWNDEFLDEIASKTGGSSIYISSADAMVRFLNNHVRNLANVFTERMKLSVATNPDIQMELAFKLSPHPQPIEIGGEFIHLGSLQTSRPISILMQYQLPANMDLGFRNIVRLVASGDILQNSSPPFQAVSDLEIEITAEQQHEEPPPAILDALSKLTLYRLQERAQQALEDGNIAEATKRLENLATRLLEMGEDDLARQTRQEAQRVAQTMTFSDKGKKIIKYQTRYLLAPGTSIIDEIS
jgi:Ca-activated chloride channel homolog